MKLNTVIGRTWLRAGALLIGFVLIAALVLLGPTVGPQVVTALQRGVGQASLVGQHDFGAWSYVAVREPDGRLTAQVSFDDHSVKGIKAFIQANKDLATQLASSKEEIEVQVDFWTPVAPDAYRTWAGASGITYFRVLNLEVVSQSGLVGSGFIVSNSSDPLPQNALDKMIKGDPGTARTKGVFSLGARVSPNHVAALGDSPLVLVADVTPNIIRQDLRASGMAEADVQAVFVNPRTTYNAMVTLGASNFR